MADSRYIIQRLATGEFLEYELPLVTTGPRFDRSGAGALTGTISPEWGRLIASDDKPLLDEWSTAIYSEVDGEIEWGGIVIHSRQAGSTWTVEAAGFRTVLQGLIYDDVHAFPMGVDPLTVVRFLWDYAQQHPRNQHLGVTVTGDTDSGVELGDEALAEFRQVFVGGAWVSKSSVSAGDIDPHRSAPLYRKISKTATSMRLRSLAGMDSITLPFNVTVGTEVIEVHGITGTTLTGLVRGVGNTTPTSHYAGTAVVYQGTPERIVSAVPEKPYTLSVFESDDCGAKLDKLAAFTPFDYVEHHRWSGDQIVHEFEVRSPRIGSQRDDLVFVQGDNIIEVVEVDRDGDDYANEVIGLGAGSGEDAVRASVDSIDISAGDDGRLRRTRLSPDKAERSAAALEKRIRRELATRLGIEEVIETITVIDHPNAPIGSWSVGDDIFIQATLPWLGDVAMYCRVESWQRLEGGKASIRLSSYSSSAHAQLARELLEISQRIAPLERSTQAVNYSDDYSATATKPKYNYNVPDISDDFSTAGFDPIAASDMALDRIDALEAGLGSGLGGGGGSGNFVYANADGTWPPRPSDTPPPAFGVMWIGPNQPEIVPSGTGGALTGDLWVSS